MPTLPCKLQRILLSPRHWLCLLLFLGLAWRLLDYALNFPYWGDEAMLLINVLNRSYTQLLQPLAHDQVAPLFFLWIEKFTLTTIGRGEWATRLVPLLASLASLPILFRLARHYGDRWAARIAFALLCISLYPIRNALCVKPYSIDLLIASALLLAGIRLLKRPDRLAPALFLACIAPFTVLLSYPSVFIIAALALAVGPRLFRRGTLSIKLAFLTFLLLTAAAFLLQYLYVGRYQFNDSRAAMEAYWAMEFPPLNLSLPLWFLKAHLSGMMSYPMGGKYGIALLILPLCILGAIRIARRRSPAAMLLLILPFALTFIASIFHRYPYGGPSRVTQHLVPSIFILTGHGTTYVFTLLAGVLQRFKIPRDGTFRIALVVLFIFYAIVAIIGMVSDIRHPWINVGSRDTRQIIRMLTPPDLLPTDQLILILPAADAPLNVEFDFYLQLQPHRTTPHPLSRDGTIDLALRGVGSSRIWFISQHLDPAPILPPIADQLAASGFHVTTAYHDNRIVEVGMTGLPRNHCETMLLEVTAAIPTTAPLPNRH